MAVQQDVVGTDAARNLVFLQKSDGLSLWKTSHEVAEHLHVYLAILFDQQLCQGDHRFLAHAVDEKVCTRWLQNGGHEAVLPVVVVGEASEAGFDAANDDGHIGVEFFENACIDDGRIFGTEVMATVRGVSVFGTETFVGCVFVHHGVHGSRSNAKEEAWTTQFLEVSVISMPVRLWYNSHFQPFCLKNAADDSSRKRRMVNVCVAREEDNIEFIPSEPF